MPPLNVLIKPVSSSCNLNCSYCFYKDVSAHREVSNYGIMSTDTLELVIKRIFEYAEGECTIAWQGGEPTLAGLSFFQSYLHLEQTYNAKGVHVNRSIQTNGYHLDAAWASFFSEYHFLVGLSLDGTQSSHDIFRKTKENENSFSSVISTIRLFKKFNVDYNILTVVNHETAQEVQKIYSFYQEQGFHYQQYIACLDPLEEKPGQHPWSLTPLQYGSFLIELFKLWYQDALIGRAPYIRQFENYLGILLGFPPDACEQTGICGKQKVIEADASVYPCDFYVVDKYRLGNLEKSSIKELQETSIQQNFIRSSMLIPSNCKACIYSTLCRNGCRRHRLYADGTNYFCQSYQMFFKECIPMLLNLGEKIRN